MIFVVEPVRSGPSAALPKSCFDVAAFIAYAPSADTVGAAAAAAGLAAAVLSAGAAAWAGAAARTPVLRTAPATTATAPRAVTLLPTPARPVRHARSARSVRSMVMVPPSVSGQLTVGQSIRSGGVEPWRGSQEPG